MTAETKTITLAAIELAIQSAKRRQNTNKNPAFREVYEADIAAHEKAKVEVTAIKV